MQHSLSLEDIDAVVAAATAWCDLSLPGGSVRSEVSGTEFSDEDVAAAIADLGTTLLTAKLKEK